MDLRTLLVRRAAGHEGPLDRSLWGLCEGECPRDLKHTYYKSPLKQACTAGWVQTSTIELLRLASTTW